MGNLAAWALLALALVCTLGSCRSGPSSLYAWGGYERSVLSLTQGEGAADIDAQIDALNETVERARQSDRRVPPGMHAHIGLLYSMRGEVDTARAAFETEKELYPESAAFIDGIFARMEASR